MTTASKAADTEFAQRTLFVVNMMAAILGGLSLVLVVAGPFMMAMTSWNSFTDVVVAACFFGGTPLACLASILYSRWLFGRGVEVMAVVVAIVPLIIVVAILAWDFAGS